MKIVKEMKLVKEVKIVKGVKIVKEVKKLVKEVKIVKEVKRSGSLWRFAYGDVFHKCDDIVFTPSFLRCHECGDIGCKTYLEERVKYDMKFYRSVHQYSKNVL